MLSNDAWENLIDTLFQCPGKEGVYILGCFATNVTLYTQQVRAFNLIAGLHQTGRLKPGQSVGVIGAGAAGLSAAAAAAHLGYKVYLYEKCESPLELQLNNRQRWIHPFIYDWPKRSLAEREAKLPLLNWDAAYAEAVATQILEGWNAIKNKVICTYSVPGLNISDGIPNKGRISISPYDSGGTIDYVDHLVMAIGFGIEQGQHRQSYWAEDDFDFGFLREKERWLIEGRGDGALTDLMRLCVKRFRHEEILNLFSTVEGIELVMEDLKDLEQKHASKGAPLSEEELEDELSAAFFNKVKNLKLRNRINTRFRNSGPHVTLVARKHAIFGRKSSVLNRLIAAILLEDHRKERPDDRARFDLHIGEIGSVSPQIFVPGEPPVHKVTFKGQPKVHDFHRIIYRHGPSKEFVSHVLDESFGIEELKKRWKSRKYPDLAVEPQWDPGVTFGPETKAARESSQVKKNDPRASVRLRGLTFQQDLKGDGSSILTYLLEGLSVLSGGEAISKVHIRFRSASGMFGLPYLDEDSKRQGFDWIPDPHPPLDHSLSPVDRAVESRKVASGVVRFPAPLLPEAPPISFSLSAVAINSDAFTVWELDHLYTPELAKDLDDTPLHDTDYVARIVYFPVDTLTTRINLPEIPGLGSPEFSYFQRSSQNGAEEPPTLVKDGVVYLTPPPNAKDWLSDRKWKFQNLASLGGSAVVTSSSPYSSELKVSEPHIGDAFKVAWKVSKGPDVPEFEKIVQSATTIRAELIRYTAWRRGQGPVSPVFHRISELLREVHADLSKAQERLSPTQPFEIALMTLNEATNRVEYLDGVNDKGDLMEKLDSFSLPFGVGLSGSCFKRPDRAYIYHPKSPRALDWPEYYLSVQGRKHPKSLIAIGLDNVGWYHDYAQKNCERSRQCLAVLDISTLTEAPWFQAITDQDLAEVGNLMNITQKFADKIVEAFGVPPPK